MEGTTIEMKPGSGLASAIADMLGSETLQAAYTELGGENGTDQVRVMYDGEDPDHSNEIRVLIRGYEFLVKVEEV